MQDLNHSFNLDAHIEKIKDDLKPPVGNKCIFNEKMTFMVVGGPNQREEYHIECGEELFFQLKGGMDLWIVEKGTKRLIRIEEGEMFLLPPRVPHNPRRYPDTVGLVWERVRGPEETDGMRWYVDATGPVNMDILYEEYFHCINLGTQLKPIIQGFLATESFATRVPMEGMPMATTPVQIDPTATEPPTFLLESAITAAPFGVSTIVDGEFKVLLVKGDYDGSVDMTGISQATAWAWRAGTGGATSMTAPEGDVHSMSQGSVVYLKREAEAAAQAAAVTVKQSGAHAAFIIVHNETEFEKPADWN